MIDSIPVVDTHTGGEITRVLLAADIGLEGNSPRTHLEQLRTEFDWVRKALTSEPRGAAYAVGAVVTPPAAHSGEESTGQGSIVFFNNVGYLGMCGHGLIGVVESLSHQHLITAGSYRFDTPAGSVSATLASDHQVSFFGVPSFCYRQDITLVCEDGQKVMGDLVYGGNWFFLAADDSVQTASIDQLMKRAGLIREAIERAGIRGRGGAVIDHVELYGDLAGETPGCRNFVLCPGGHYDRSPCGTGTSAKLACLAARGRLDPGSQWVQESVTGSRFVASYQWQGETVRVNITGRAHVMAETKQVFDRDDPLRFGIGGHADE